jgi:hypothetical protein
MEAGAMSLLWLGVILIPLIMLLIVGGSYWLARSWRSKAIQEIELAKSELQQAESRHQNLIKGFKLHSPDDPEPYGPKVKLLQTRLQDIETELQASSEGYHNIQPRLLQQGLSPLQAVVGAPLSLFDLRREITIQRRAVESQQIALAEAEESLRVIDRLPWEVSRLARQSQERGEQIRKSVEGMQRRNIQGTAMENAAEQEGQLRAWLAQIPPNFYSDDEVKVLEGADKEAVIAVYAMLRKIRPDQEKMIAQLHGWEKQFGEAQQKTAQMQQRLASLEAALESAPAMLDLDAGRKQFQGMRVIAQNLQAALGRAEIESLGAISAESERVSQAADELEQTLQLAHTQSADLVVAMAELDQHTREVTAQITSLGSSKIHPVVWTRSSTALLQLNQGARAIGSIDKQRTPEALEHDLIEVQQLSSETLILRDHCQQVADQHAELLALLGGVEFSQAGLWQQNALTQAKRVSEYDPQNWTRTDAVSGLPGELQTLGTGLQQFVTGNPAEPVLEDEIADRLGKTRQLALDSQALRGRMNLIEARLAALQQAENESHEQLEAAKKTLVQVAYLVRSNPFLGGAVQEIDRLQSQLDSLGDELNLRQRGTVETKSRRITAAATKTEQALNCWLDRLNQETQTKVKAITACLTRLDSIAPLDDPPVVEAQRLLASGPPYGVSGYGQKSQFKLDALVREFKQRSDYGQACAAGLRALEDIEKPVVETYNMASQNRQQLKEQANEISAWLRQTQTWPPTSVDLRAEQKEIATLEGQWGAFKAEPVRGIELVKRLGGLSNEYQRSAERVRRLAEQAGKEQDTAETLVREIDHFSQLWEKQFYAQRDNRPAREDIRGLLDQISQELYRIKSQYRERVMDYARVMQALKTLQRKARLHQVALDDSHVIDVNGRVITSRESTRAPGDW